MDLDTFFTTLYVVIDDWYKTEGHGYGQRRKAGRTRLSDSEVLTIAVAAQWQRGVPWSSERSMIRFLQRAGRAWFPQLLGISAFNRRERCLCGALAALQRYLAAQLGAEQSVYEVMDGLPLPVCSLGHLRRQRTHWLGLSSSLGHGGNHGGWFYGQRWWVSVSAEGVITGWVVGAAHLNERWLVEALVSCRAGTPALHLPTPDPHTARAARPTLPGGFLGAWFAAGLPAHAAVYLADRGLNGRMWQQQWWSRYHVRILSVPPVNSREFQAWTSRDCHWLASHRQVIETVYACLTAVFGLQRVNAHSLWGQFTRLAAKAAAYNFALWVNRSLGRSFLAVETLLA